MDKDNLKNFSIIDNRGNDTPINTSCDHIIDTNGNIIYQCYKSIYKLTYKHIYKYKRITTISTDVIYDNHGNAFTPLYHYCYDDVNENNNPDNLDEKSNPDNLDEISFYAKSTKQPCLKYDLYELLMLRSLNYNEENNDEEILHKNCFLKERKSIKSGFGMFHKDTNNSNTITPNNINNNSNSNIIVNNNNPRIRSPYNEDSPIGRKYSYSLNSINNLNNKFFKSLDNNCYNSPENNIYIDKEGKMHLTEKNFYNSNNNFNNKNLANKYDRNLYFQKKEKGFMDYEYNDKLNTRKNNSEVYWDNPIHYPNKNNYDIFTLGDIKKYSKNNEKQKNNFNFNDNNYSIFKDNDEENLTKSNFAKWFKSNDINVNENIDLLKYLNNKNKQSDVDIKSNSQFNHRNRNYEHSMYNNYHDNSYTNIDTNINSGNTNEKRISNTVAELLINQISMIKERNSVDNLEKRNSYGFFDNNYHTGNSMHIDKNNISKNDLYSKEVDKRILEIFKTINYNNLAQDQEQNQSYNNNISSNIGNNINTKISNINNSSNMNYHNNDISNNKNNKYYYMGNMSYKQNYLDNYMDGSTIDHFMMNKKSMKNKDILNDYNMLDKNKNAMNSFNSYNNKNYPNLDNYNSSHSNLDSYKSINNKQSNINITPIINSLLRLDNENEYNNDNKIPSSPNNYISENIQNAKVNNVLDSLKSLLKASKNQNNKSFNVSKNFNHNNKYMNYNSNKFYPQQFIQQNYPPFNEFNKKKFPKKDKFNIKYSESDMITNDTALALKSLIQNQGEINK